MQIINDVRQRAQVLLQENATTLLTAGGVVGTVATAVLAGRASFKAADIIREHELNAIHTEPVDDTIVEGTMGLDRKAKVLLVGPLFIPPVLTGGLTVASIVLANRMNAQKAAALAAAYGLSQKQLEEYKNKVADKLGVAKTQKLEDELAQDRVDRAEGSTLVIVSDGEVLCFDEPNGRFFKSTMQMIDSAVNATNTEILHHDHASATFFYEELGLPGTTWTDEVGWNTDNLVELKKSTVLSPEKKPCIAIDFKVLPSREYIRPSY